MGKPPGKRGRASLRSCIPHLRYLSDQLTAFLLVQGQPAIIQNALIESSLLSLRNVHDFFAPFDGRERSDDLKAYQFRPAHRAKILTRGEKEDIHKRLAHLTTRRTRTKNWASLLQAKVPKAQAEIDKFFTLVGPHNGETGKRES
jgi:hypothetical protein